MPAPLTNKKGERLVQISADVLASEYDEFIQRFPDKGSTTWLIRNSLHEFNKAVRDDPTLQEKVALAIRAMLNG